MTTSLRSAVTHERLDAVAWEFLHSEFAGSVYAGWPIDRRIEAFLTRKGPRALLDDGAGCAALLDRVMANVGRALQSGVLTSDRERHS